LLKDRIERPGVAVDHALVTIGQRVTCGDLVQPTEHRTTACVGATRALTGMVGRLARDVAQNVPALAVDAAVTRRVRIAG
jgi:hypothetical protein